MGIITLTFPLQIILTFPPPLTLPVQLLPVPMGPTTPTPSATTSHTLYNYSPTPIYNSHSYPYITRKLLSRNPHSMGTIPISHPYHSHSLSSTPSLSHSLSLLLPHSSTLSHSLTLPRPYSSTRSLSHSLSHSLTLTLSLPLSHSSTLSLSHALTSTPSLPMLSVSCLYLFPHNDIRAIIPSFYN